MSFYLSTTFVARATRSLRSCRLLPTWANMFVLLCIVSLSYSRYHFVSFDFFFFYVLKISVKYVLKIFSWIFPKAPPFSLSKSWHPCADSDQTLMRLYNFIGWRHHPNTRTSIFFTRERKKKLLQWKFSVLHPWKLDPPREKFSETTRER